MNKTKRSVPFSISILTLMALIVVPLGTALLVLGWRAVDKMEQRDGASRLAALDNAVSAFLMNDLHIIVSVGSTLAEVKSFSSEAGSSSDDGERARHLIAVLHAHPVLAAAFVGYSDGHFVFAGHMASFSKRERAEYDAPSGDPTIVRIIDGQGAERRERWWFLDPDGHAGAIRERHSAYDPRTRPWYVDPMKSGEPTLTEPYLFAQSNKPGISVGIPVGTVGVIGFDFTLDKLSRVLDHYRVTPNSIIIASTDTSSLFIESRACDASSGACLPGDAEARAELRRAMRETQSSRQSLAKEVEIAGQTYSLIVHHIPHTLGKNFIIGAIVPESELAVTSRVLLQHDAIAAGAAIGIAVLAVLVVSLLLSGPMARIAAKTERIRNLDFSDRAPIESRISEVLRLSVAVEQMREGLEVFGRYVSKDLVRQVMRSPRDTGVGGERRELTVLFSDIEGFSLLSETMEPELLTSRLSRYFEALGTPISANRGTIDKYIGDSIMAFWNAPERDDDHIANACRATFQAAEAGRLLAQKWRSRNRPGFRTRFGLHAGPAVVGNVGARERINYTLVGAVANQASRLESLNKVYRTEILASGVVAAAVADRFVWRHIDRIVPAGTTEVLNIHELMGEQSTGPDHSAFLVQWKSGRDAYEKGRFEDAAALFRSALALRPDDGPCRLFIERCSGFVLDGPPKDWDGVWCFERK